MTHKFVYCVAVRQKLSIMLNVCQRGKNFFIAVWAKVRNWIIKLVVATGSRFVFVFLYLYLYFLYMSLYLYLHLYFLLLFGQTSEVDYQVGGRHWF